MKSILSAEFSSEAENKKHHFHDDHQILYIKSGNAVISVGKNQYFTDPGTVVIISRFEAHSISRISRDYSRYSLHISPNATANNDDEILLYSLITNRPDDFVHTVKISENRSRFEALLDRIVRETRASGSMQEEMLHLLLYVLLIEIYHFFPKNGLVPFSHNIGLVKSIQTRFETEYFKSFTLTELAGEFNISAYHLSHIFKKITGYSVFGYLNECRINAAKKRLAETSDSIGEIVLSCGFSDSSNFSRMFKKATGKTPSQFRSCHRPTI